MGHAVKGFRFTFLYVVLLVPWVQGCDRSDPPAAPAAPAAQPAAAPADTRPPLPSLLAGFECERGGYFSPGDYNAWIVAKTTLVLPCRKKGDPYDLANGWARSTPDHRYVNAFEFLKRPDDGRFECSSDVSDPMPRASFARYAVNTTMTPERPARWDKPTERRGKQWEIAVKTPEAFVTTGPTTSFECEGPANEDEKFGRVRECVAKVRSKSLFWDVRVTWGLPPARELLVNIQIVPAPGTTPMAQGGEPVAAEGGVDTRDPEVSLETLEGAMPGDLQEALDVLALHIVAQE